MMFQYPIALVIFILQTMLLNVYPLVPLTESVDFTWRSYFIRSVVSVVWVAVTVGAFGLLIFGTVIYQNEYDMDKIV